LSAYTKLDRESDVFALGPIVESKPPFSRVTQRDVLRDKTAWPWKYPE
jgi:hypothetical protein